MKKLFLIGTLAFLTMVATAQEAKNLSFTQVIKVENKSKSDIYSGLRAWVAKYYRSAQSVIQMDDRESGVIIVKALFPYNFGKMMYAAYEGKVDYTLKLQARDGRFRAEMDNFIHSIGIDHATHTNKNCNLGLITTAELYTDKGAQKKFHNNVWNDIKAKAEAESLEAFKSLNAITDFNEDEKSEEW